MACPVLFLAYMANVFDKRFSLLLLILGVGLSTSIVAVFALYGRRKGLVLSVLSLFLNLSCSGYIAFLVLVDD